MQRAPVGSRRWGKTCLFEPGENKIVDGVAGPSGLVDFWQRRILDWLKGPMTVDFLLSFLLFLIHFFRPRGSAFDPLDQHRDLVC